VKRCTLSASEVGALNKEVVHQDEREHLRGSQEDSSTKIRYVIVFVESEVPF